MLIHCFWRRDIRAAPTGLFSREEQIRLIDMAHEAGKKVTIAVNGIMHPEKMKRIPEYLAFLKTNQADQIALGDPGIIYRMKQNPECALPFIYAGETLVTSARQINFGDKKEQRQPF